jgi:hypothetical protein
MLKYKYTQLQSIFLNKQQRLNVYIMVSNLTLDTFYSGSKPRKYRSSQMPTHNLMNDAACGTHFSKCRFLVARRFRQRSLKIRQSSRKVFEKPENSSTWIGKQAFSRCTAPSLTTVYSHSYLLFDNVLITLIVFSPSLYFSSHTLYLSLPISLIQPLPPPKKKKLLLLLCTTHLLLLLICLFNFWHF